MRYLILTNTPAHVHLYKHVVRELEQRGHDVRVLVRDYGCTRTLAEAYDLPYRVYGKCDTTKWSLFRNLPIHYARIAVETLRFDPDLIFGMGAYAAHAGGLSRTPVVLVLDSEPTALDHAISAPFATAMLTPESFRRNLGPNHHVFPGFKESAYLHPDVFDADPSVRAELGVGDDPFAILRFNAFGSHHDVEEAGFTPDQRRELIRTLAEELQVVVSDEGDDLDVSDLPAVPFDLHPSRLHDALAEASLLVADTQTMVTEAALLGTPAIRSNSFVGENDMGNFQTLEAWGLVENESEFLAVLDTALGIVHDPDSEDRWERRRDQLLAGTVDLSELLVAVAENHETVGELPALSTDTDRTDSPLLAPERLRVPEQQP